MTILHDTFSTPVGDFSVALDDSGALLATAFGDVASLKTRLKQRHLSGDFACSPARSEAVRQQVAEYFAGTRRHFNLRLAAKGTGFQQQVWTKLTQIPWGETRTYAEIAVSLSRPGAARAVGRANATNPICLIVPCHRVIGADRALTGFAFGEPIKQRLLEHEGALAHALSR